MRGAASVVADAGADLIDLNMGCPVRKVRKTGAGAELLADPDLAVAVAARRGRGRPGPAGDGEAPLRAAAGRHVGRRAGGPAGRGGRRRGDRLPPPLRGRRHKGAPDYALVREVAARVEVPVIVSGGLDSAASSPARLRALRGRRGDDRPRLLRQPLDLRGADRARARPRRARPRSPRSCSGSSPAPRSTSASAAPPATCGSSTPGTRSGLGIDRSDADEFQRLTDLSQAREMISRVASQAAPETV